MITELVIPAAIWRKMRRHARRNAPLEACGLLAGKDGQVSLSQGVRNDERSPVRFQMNPKEQLKAFNHFEDMGLDLLAIYHSHPSGPTYPSPIDIQQAAYAVVYIIWSLQAEEWKVDGYWIESDQVSVVSLRIV
jgi:proteasome lid subunit RPN8/RPN11